jgi:hypothetical protein
MSTVRLMLRDIPQVYVARQEVGPMTVTWARIIATTALAAGGTVLAATPASADMVTPPGSCVGLGQWQAGGFTEVSTQHVPSDVIDVPLKDTIKYAGSENGAKLSTKGPRREIEGAVRIDMPYGNVEIDSWGGSSTRYANTGTHAYDFPKILGGVKVKLSGYHKDAGTLTCSGSVYLRLAGGGFDNPLEWASLAGLVLTGGTLLWAGRPVARNRNVG